MNEIRTPKPTTARITGTTASNTPSAFCVSASISPLTAAALLVRAPKIEMQMLPMFQDLKEFSSLI